MSLAPPATLDAGPAADGWRAAVAGAVRRRWWRWWRWRLRALWRRPGLRPVAAGCAALAAAAGLSLLLVPRWQAEAAAAGQALHQRARNAGPTMPQQPPQAPGPARRLQAALPEADQAPRRVAGLLDLARRHGIEVRSARQSAATGTDGATVAAATSPPAAATASRLPAVQAVPLAWHALGRYADLRAFVAAALQADPGLVLDRLHLSRADARAELLDADLQWQLLQQADAPAPALPAPARPGR